MPETDAMARYAPVRLPTWIYLNGESIRPGGATAQATIPSRATIFEIAAEQQDCYYAINGIFADVDSPGFVVAGGREVVGPIGNLRRLDVYCAAGGTAHIQYFREG